MKKPVITICSSANFYRKVVELQAKLEQAGFKAIIPTNAEKMKQTGNYDAAFYKTWHQDANDYHKKTAFMRQHFDEVEKGDVILVVNEEKHGQVNYIGGNVLIEMALGFYLHKPLYILNGIPEQSGFLEEILGMNPIVLKGNLTKLITDLEK